MSGEEIDGFDLAAIADEELRGPVADLNIVTAHIVKRIPEEYLREVLEQALGPWVADRARTVRTRSKRQAEATPSTRWAEASDLYSKLLRQRESVDGTWKFLGDMTTEEVLSVAALRIENGRASIARGKVYELLAAKMAEHMVALVRELSTEQLNEVFAS